VEQARRVHELGGGGHVEERSARRSDGAPEELHEARPEPLGAGRAREPPAGLPEHPRLGREHASEALLHLLDEIRRVDGVRLLHARDLVQKVLNIKPLFESQRPPCGPPHAALRVAASPRASRGPWLRARVSPTRADAHARVSPTPASRSARASRRRAWHLGYVDRPVAQPAHAQEPRAR